MTANTPANPSDPIHIDIFRDDVRRQKGHYRKLSTNVLTLKKIKNSASALATAIFIGISRYIDILRVR
ncbi:hypothetical protein [Candidatus Magnetobacterium casense]|uniref:Uncharacterized protein n=1 Tax=Candidatus Magnetobacterium casense TaxID=1455061 RepID=A0ABS6S086_9BACT|nr:hypothetical protein [Candidatus Magnetobacterium casensis]MBV6342271.1 hypothetical protein [Candidatus Magnetobacterium casensis]